MQKILKDIDPEGTVSQRGYRLRKRIYRNPGPNYAWHTEGRDKLKPFGFAIHGATYGYSREIIWIGNKEYMIGNFYLDCVKEFQGCLTHLLLI